MSFVDSLLGVDASALFAVTWLYGGYMVLFFLTLWATYQRPSMITVRLRIVALVTFTAITLHVVVKLAFFFIPIPNENTAASYAVIFPNDLSHIMPCITGLLSDGLLAWRCYVLWGKERWIKRVLISMIVADAVVGITSNIAYGQYLSVLFHSQDQDRLRRFETVATVLLLAWVWLFFAINTVMTGSIITKIAHVALMDKPTNVGGERSSAVYRNVIRAIIESSLVSWIGLLTYGITTIGSKPTRPSDDVWGRTSAAMLACLPVLLGISQCLIIARIGLSRYMGDSSALTRSRPSAFELAAHVLQRFDESPDLDTALPIKFASSHLHGIDDPSTASMA